MSHAFRCDWCGAISEGQSAPGQFRFLLAGKGGVEIEVTGSIHLPGLAYVDLCPLCKTTILTQLVSQGVAQST